MRLLLLTPNPPSPIRVRPYQLALALVGRGHAVDIACPVATPREAEDLRRLSELGLGRVTAPLGRLRRAANLAAAVASPPPLQARYAWSPALAEALDAAIDRAAAEGRPYDLVQVEHLRGSAYAPALAARLPLVWDSVDCISDLFAQTRLLARSLRARLMATLELERTRRLEGRLVARLHHLAVTAETDRAALLALRVRHLLRTSPPGAGTDTAAADAATRPDIRVIPNGVDPTRFAACDPAAREPATILFSGKLSYHANAAAARSLLEAIMPRVWAERPEARLLLAGAEPPRALRRLAEADPRVTVTGYVEDLRACLCRASLAVAPLTYGVGIQNKVLEAMASATPVVASPVAARALGARPDRELLLGEDAEAMARQIQALLDDPQRAAALGRAGRDYVAEHHGWGSAAASFEGLYASAIQAAG
ncbi:MAG: glycosyltransferase [Chloroflexi bacterium]|nr:glycosyltransferase [Chloroflexota bacterium]